MKKRNIFIVITFIDLAIWALAIWFVMRATR